MHATAATNSFDTSPAVNTFAVATAVAWTYSGTTDFTRTGALLTYSGATRTFAIRAYVSTRIATANAVLGVGISINGDLNGATSGSAAAFAAGAQYQNQIASDGTVGIATERLITLSAGNTINLVGATNAGALDMSIDRAQIVIVAD